eukprot:1158256-Pelagomonas_calceolata.AAC.10
MSCSLASFLRASTSLAAVSSFASWPALRSRAVVMRSKNLANVNATREHTHTLAVCMPTEGVNWPILQDMLFLALHPCHPGLLRAPPALEYGMHSEQAMMGSPAVSGGQERPCMGSKYAMDGRSSLHGAHSAIHAACVNKA